VAQTCTPWPLLVRQSATANPYQATTKHTGCRRTHTHEHQSLWREALGSELGTLLATKGGPARQRAGRRNGGGAIQRPFGNGRRLFVKKPHQTPPRQLQAALQQVPRTTPRPLARHAFDDLYGQDSVVGSDGFDGLNDEGDSDFFDYSAGGLPPPPFPRGWCSEVLLRLAVYNPLHNNKKA
jgi:hypothetical protein